MKITVLGCGTSTGVPMIGCRCHICTSEDKRNKRLRASLLISSEGGNVLIDTSTDLRQQALSNDIRSLAAVLFTHHHADHVHGIDELRSFNFIQKSEIPCYGNVRTLQRIQEMFSYIFNGVRSSGGKPRLLMNEVNAPFEAAGIRFDPVKVSHGDISILGYRFGKAAYITDCSMIPEESLKKLEGLDILILGALRPTPHDKHFSLDEAVAAAKKISPGKTYFTHMGHEIDYEKTSAELPDGIELAYDGMTIEL